LQAVDSVDSAVDTNNLPGNQPGVIGLPAKPITPGFSVVSKENQRAADLGKHSAICVFMGFYAIL
jgi:hypothetical protein